MITLPITLPEPVVAHWSTRPPAKYFLRFSYGTGFGCRFTGPSPLCLDLEAAVALWVSIRYANNLGASESPTVWVFDAATRDPLYRISYNGRIWSLATGLEVLP